MKKLRLGVLGSGKGSNFRALVEALQEKGVPAEVVMVASDRAEAGILEWAKEFKIPTWVCPRGKWQSKLEAEIEEALAKKLLEAGVELVVLAGYMRVVKEPLLRSFSRRMINIHPSLLPAFPGLRAWEQAYQAGVEETGCTVHWVSEVVDGGAIIRQSKVRVESGDNAEKLHARIQVAEHKLLPEVVMDLALGRIEFFRDGKR